MKTETVEYEAPGWSQTTAEGYPGPMKPVPLIPPAWVQEGLRTHEPPMEKDDPKRGCLRGVCGDRKAATARKNPSTVSWQPVETASGGVAPQSYSTQSGGHAAAALDDAESEDYHDEKESSSSAVTTTTGSWDIHSRYIQATRTGPTSWPPHIQAQRAEFSLSAPSPLMLYYYDETAPNDVLLNNDVRGHPETASKDDWKKVVTCQGGRFDDYPVEGDYYSEKLSKLDGLSHLLRSDDAKSTAWEESVGSSSSSASSYEENDAVSGREEPQRRQRRCCAPQSVSVSYTSTYGSSYTASSVTSSSYTEKQPVATETMSGTYGEVAVAPSQPSLTAMSYAIVQPPDVPQDYGRHVSDVGVVKYSVAPYIDVVSKHSASIARQSVASHHTADVNQGYAARGPGSAPVSRATSITAVIMPDGSYILRQKCDKCDGKGYIETRLHGEKKKRTCTCTETVSMATVESVGQRSVGIPPSQQQHETAEPLRSATASRQQKHRRREGCCRRSKTPETQTAYTDSELVDLASYKAAPSAQGYGAPQRPSSVTDKASHRVSSHVPTEVVASKTATEKRSGRCCEPRRVLSFASQDGTQSYVTSTMSQREHPKCCGQKRYVSAPRSERPAETASSFSAEPEPPQPTEQPLSSYHVGPGSLPAHRVSRTNDSAWKEPTKPSRRSCCQGRDTHETISEAMTPRQISASGAEEMNVTYPRTKKAHRGCCQPRDTVPESADVRQVSRPQADDHGSDYGSTTKPPSRRAFEEGDDGIVHASAALRPGSHHPQSEDGTWTVESKKKSRRHCCQTVKDDETMSAGTAEEDTLVAGSVERRSTVSGRGHLPSSAPKSERGGVRSRSPSSARQLAPGSQDQEQVQPHDEKSVTYRPPQKPEGKRDYGYTVRKMFFNAEDEVALQNTAEMHDYMMCPTYSVSYKNYPIVCYDAVVPRNYADFFRVRAPPM